MDYLGFTKKNNNAKRFITNTISKILICTIVLLLSIIYTKDSTENRTKYRKEILEKNISFSKIKNIYNKYLGDVLPFNSVNNTKTVFNDSNFLSNTKYLDGNKINLSNNYVNSISSGIVVFVGNKDDYNKTLIIQGSDGTDIWYGNLLDINITLYDYIEENSLIGTANDNTLYLLIKKDEKVIAYEEYTKDN